MTDRIAIALERIAEALEQIQKAMQGQIKAAEDAPAKAQAIVDNMMKSFGGHK